MGINISAALFDGKPVKKRVILNQDDIERAENEIEAGNAYNAHLEDGEEPLDLPKVPEPQSAIFYLTPVTGDLDAEYTKRRGQDEQVARYHLAGNKRGQDEPKVKLEAMERKFSNSKEIASLKWLAEKVVHGWEEITLSDGNLLEFSGKNLAVMASLPKFIRPVIAAAYELNQIIEEAEEGNFETSSDGSVFPS